MVIDDEVAQMISKKSGLKLATPPGVKLPSILPVAKAAENILAGKYDSQRLFREVHEKNEIKTRCA